MDCVAENDRWLGCLLPQRMGNRAGIPLRARSRSWVRGRGSPSSFRGGLDEVHLPRACLMGRRGWWSRLRILSRAPSPGWIFVHPSSNLWSGGPGGVQTRLPYPARISFLGPSCIVCPTWRPSVARQHPRRHRGGTIRSRFPFPSRTTLWVRTRIWWVRTQRPSLFEGVRRPPRCPPLPPGPSFPATNEHESSSRREQRATAGTWSATARACVRSRTGGTVHPPGTWRTVPLRVHRPCI